MSDDQNIYKNQASQYERLVSREDYQGSLLRAISEILPLDGLTVLESVAGTGRVTCLCSSKP